MPNEEIVKLAVDKPNDYSSVILGWEVFYPLWFGENKLNRYELAAMLAVRPCWIVYGK